MSKQVDPCPLCQNAPIIWHENPEWSNGRTIWHFTGDCFRCLRWEGVDVLDLHVASAQWKAAKANAHQEILAKFAHLAVGESANSQMG